MPTLEERIQRLEDLEEIRRLKITYARYADDRVPGAQYASLFTEDGVVDAEPLGTAKGRAEIAQFAEDAKKALTFYLHYMMGQTIDIAPSGTEATGHWYLWEAATAGDEAVWIAITYNDEYKNVDGKWLFSYSKLNFHFITPFDKGWVKQRMIEMG